MRANGGGGSCAGHREGGERVRRRRELRGPPWGRGSPGGEFHATIWPRCGFETVRRRLGALSGEERRCKRARTAVEGVARAAVGAGSGFGGEENCAGRRGGGGAAPAANFMRRFGRAAVLKPSGRWLGALSGEERHCKRARTAVEGVARATVRAGSGFGGEENCAGPFWGAGEQPRRRISCDDLAAPRF